MIQWIPGCDYPDLSLFQDSKSLEKVNGPRGPWSIRREPD